MRSARRDGRHHNPPLERTAAAVYFTCRRASRVRRRGRSTAFRYSAMAIIERHTSPDGSLILLVDSTAGDWGVGFDGYAWHTHGDVLNAWGYDGTPEARTRAFVDDIMQSRRVIVVVRVDGKVSDIF